MARVKQNPNLYGTSANIEMMPARRSAPRRGAPRQAVNNDDATHTDSSKPTRLTWRTRQTAVEALALADVAVHFPELELISPEDATSEDGAEENDEAEFEAEPEAGPDAGEEGEAQVAEMERSNNGSDGSDEGSGELQNDGANDSAVATNENANEEAEEVDDTEPQAKRRRVTSRSPKKSTQSRSDNLAVANVVLKVTEAIARANPSSTATGTSKRQQEQEEKSDQSEERDESDEDNEEEAEENHSEVEAEKQVRSSRRLRGLQPPVHSDTDRNGKEEAARRAREQPVEAQPTTAAPESAQLEAPPAVKRKQGRTRKQPQNENGSNSNEANNATPNSTLRRLQATPASSALRGQAHRRQPATIMAAANGPPEVLRARQTLRMHTASAGTQQAVSVPTDTVSTLVRLMGGAGWTGRSTWKAAFRSKYEDLEQETLPITKEGKEIWLFLYELAVFFANVPRPEYPWHAEFAIQVQTEYLRSEQEYMDMLLSLVSPGISHICYETLQPRVDPSINRYRAAPVPTSSSPRLRALLVEDMLTFVIPQAVALLETVYTLGGSRPDEELDLDGFYVPLKTARFTHTTWEIATKIAAWLAKLENVLAIELGYRAEIGYQDVRGDSRQGADKRSSSSSTEASTATKRQERSQVKSLLNQVQDELVRARIELHRSSDRTPRSTNTRRPRYLANPREFISAAVRSHSIDNDNTVDSLNGSTSPESLAGLVVANSVERVSEIVVEEAEEDWEVVIGNGDVVDNPVVVVPAQRAESGDVQDRLAQSTPVADPDNVDSGIAGGENAGDGEAGGIVWDADKDAEPLMTPAIVITTADDRAREAESPEMFVHNVEGGSETPAELMQEGSHGTTQTSKAVDAPAATTPETVNSETTEPPALESRAYTREELRVIMARLRTAGSKQLNLVQLAADLGRDIVDVAGQAELIKNAVRAAVYREKKPIPRWAQAGYVIR